MLGEAIEEAAVAGGDFAEEAAETVEVVGVVSGRTKGHLIIGLGMGGLGGLGKGVTIVEKKMDGDLDGAGEFLERLDGGNGMAVFDAREIAAEQSGAALDVALGEIALFPEQAESLTYSHSG